MANRSHPPPPPPPPPSPASEWEESSPHFHPALDPATPAAPGRPSLRFPEPLRPPKPGWSYLIAYMVAVTWHLFFVDAIGLSVLFQDGDAAAMTFIVTPIFATILIFVLHSGPRALRLILILLVTPINILGALVYFVLALVGLLGREPLVGLLGLAFLIANVACTWAGIHHNTQLDRHLFGPRVKTVPKPPPEPELEISGDWDQAKPRAPQPRPSTTG